MSAPLHQTTCRGCGRPVLFAIDEHGTQVILDARAPVYLVSPYAPAEPNRVARCAAGYVSHFATCPAAEHFDQARRCVCGHSQGHHPHGACDNYYCVCLTYQAAPTPGRTDPTP